MWRDCLVAFLTGGLLCAIGQVLIDYTKLTPARILTSYVVAGVLLSAIGLYPKLIAFAGGGASVPLTGFGHLLAQGVRDAIAEKGVLGIFTGGLTAASGGLAAALFFGLVAALVFRPKDK
jgi:stage V sporulation protein AE